MQIAPPVELRAAV